MVERVLSMHEVPGSNPGTSIEEFLLTRSLGEGQKNPPWYSFLRNPLNISSLALQSTPVLIFG